MREIKFRAWHAPTKRWIINFRLDKTGGILIGSAVMDTYKYIAGMDYKLMQYTGLKDKNGKEIYEGDILSDGVSEPVIMDWDDNEALFGSREIGFGTAKDFYSRQEVIGNIYENTELLKEDKWK